MTNILKELVAINTVKDLENNKIREYIKTLLLPLNFSFEEIGNNDKKILIAKRGKSNIGFVCHTDTVDFSSQWTEPPFTLTQKNKKLYGLGVADMKGGIAALLKALLEIDISYPCTCYFTYDEEIGFEGIKNLIKEKKDFPPILIFTEPTDNIPIIANKGCLEFKVIFNGKSAHSSTPMLGDNAIYKAICFIDELKIFSDKLKDEQNTIYDIPYTTFNLAKIEGGNAINKVADNCQIYFDFRTVSKKQEIEISTKLKDLAKKYKAKVEILNNVSCAKCETKEFQNKIESICNAKCSGLNYVTEASFFNNKNILILGPGPVTAHQKNEYIYLESFKKTIEIYKKIIIELS